MGRGRCIRTCWKHNMWWLKIGKIMQFEKAGWHDQCGWGIIIIIINIIHIKTQRTDKGDHGWRISTATSDWEPCVVHRKFKRPWYAAIASWQNEYVTNLAPFRERERKKTKKEKEKRECFIQIMLTYSHSYSEMMIRSLNCREIMSHHKIKYKHAQF